MMASRREGIKKVNELIKDIKIAMLMSEGAEGEYHSRPMTTQQREFDGDLWFFSGRTAGVVREITKKPNVNVVYVDGGKYVSIAGKAEIVTDVKKKKELWNELLRVWFKDGPESEEVVLIRVDSKSAQYWDTPSGPLGYLADMIKVVLTGDKEEGAGESAKVKF
jgi:general stress protein 26